jgi:hypothetical protein
MPQPIDKEFYRAMTQRRKERNIFSFLRTWGALRLCARNGFSDLLSIQKFQESLTRFLIFGCRVGKLLEIDLGKLIFQSKIGNPKSKIG